MQTLNQSLRVLIKKRSISVKTVIGYSENKKEFTAKYQAWPRQERVNGMLDAVRPGGCARFATASPCGVCPELETKLAHAFGLKDAVVVPGSNDSRDAREIVGMASGAYLSGNLKPGDASGLSRGGRDERRGPGLEAPFGRAVPVDGPAPQGVGKPYGLRRRPNAAADEGALHRPEDRFREQSRAARREFRVPPFRTPQEEAFLSASGALLILALRGAGRGGILHGFALLPRGEAGGRLGCRMLRCYRA